MGISKNLYLGLVLGLSSVATWAIKDCTSIELQIEAAKKAGGGRIVIERGKYLCRKPLVLDADNLELVGNGDVLLKLAEHANAPVLIIGDTETVWGTRDGKTDFYTPKTVRHIVVENLSIDGSTFDAQGKLLQEHECWKGPCGAVGKSAIRNNGITIRGAEDVLIDRVHTFNNRSGGIVSEKYARRLHLRHIRSDHNFFDGIAGCQTMDSTIDDSEFFENNAAGASFDLDFSHNRFRRVKFFRNAHQGIFARSLNGLQIEDSEIRDNGYQGIFLAKNGTGPCANGVRVLRTSIIGSGRADPRFGQGIRLNDDECSNECIEEVRFGDERSPLERNRGGDLSAAGGITPNRVRNGCSP